MALHSNPLYKKVYPPAGIPGDAFYMPTETTAYHKSRELAMNGQDIFSRCGIDPETLKAYAQQLLDVSNGTKSKDTLRSDCGVIATNILLRLQNPVDELCAIRMGAIALIHEDEDPNTCTAAWIKRKTDMALANPDMFTFFLHTGIAFTPEYNNLLRGLEAEEYLTKRAETLKLLVPIQ